MGRLTFCYDTHNAIADIADERKRQDAQWGDQKDRPDGIDFHRPAFKSAANYWRHKCDEEEAAVKHGASWAHVLLEEVFEALSAESDEELFEELIQVAAVAAVWMENLRNRRKDDASE